MRGLGRPGPRCKICKGACTEIRFLLPIMQELKKKKHFKRRKNFFFIIRSLRFPKEMFNLYLFLAKESWKKKKKITMTYLILQRMEYFCKNERILEDFLNWWYIRYRYSRCADGEKHEPEICGGACTKMNFLLPIIGEFKKKDISK